ncbi:hypothetical protein HUJ05_009708 [Dendroctonus ponderosae]|nr:hypothetical protein HUJ05_009708 [Dendroctonus ponderosae]
MGNEQGDTTVDVEKINLTWKDYVKELFSGTRTEQQITNAIAGPNIHLVQMRYSQRLPNFLIRIAEEN